MEMGLLDMTFGGLITWAIFKEAAEVLVIGLRRTLFGVDLVYLDSIVLRFLRTELIVVGVSSKLFYNLFKSVFWLLN